MSNLESLKKLLLEFEENRKKNENEFPSPQADRNGYAHKIAECFLPCAEKILAGRFKVTCKIGEDVRVRFIQPTAIELYYHEEKDGGFKDPIMYHTDYRKRTDKKAKGATYFSLTKLSELPYFPVGSLNPHTSGIDVTFENAEKKYRASFLIRKYKVKYENGEERTTDNSTEIYDDMLFGGIPLNNSDWIDWEDNVEKVKAVDCDWRRNVPEYKKTSESSELWEKKKATEGNTFSIGGVSYAKCPFNWQFKIKNS